MSFTVAQIRKRVDDVLKTLEIEEPAVDVERVAEFLQADVIKKDLDQDVSGFLLIAGGKRTIAVNNEHLSNRQRFTIAHELGHLMLHALDQDEDNVFVDRKVFNRNSDASQGVYRQEIEANRFAAELLMPKKLLLKAIDDLGDEIDLSDDETLRDLASKFGVSTQAMAIRLTSLDIAPVI